ncbi:MAG: outer membrane lipoprotein-sorting protein [Fidelibacterota bacterium]
MKQYLLGLVLLFSFGWGQMTGREIMEKTDTLPEPNDAISTVTMSLIKSKKGKTRKRMRQIKRYQDFFQKGDFRSKSLIRFLKPADVKGTSLLIWEYQSDKDDDQWLYLPAMQKVKRIVAREKSTEFMGSDFTYEDMGSRDIDEDTYKLIGEDEIFGEDCYLVGALPVQKESTYSRRVVWVSKKTWIVRKVEYFNKKGELLKILTIPKLHKEGNYWTVDKMIMENVKKAHKTILEINDVKYDSGIDGWRFTERGLKRMK